jgi:hypothetical protein
MRIALKAFLTFLCFGVSGVWSSTGAFAQTGSVKISIKSGETVPLEPFYSVVNCKSRLKATPVVEIMEGPDEITVEAQDTMVLPRSQKCAKEVKGASLTLKAKEIKERKNGSLIVRLKYSTLDGDRQVSRFYDVALFPERNQAKTQADQSVKDAGDAGSK